MLNWIKKIFSEKNIKNEFQEITRQIYEDINIVYSKEIQKNFNTEYSILMRENRCIQKFKERIIDIILKNIRKTEYKNQIDFINEIRFFIIYLFLIIEDNYLIGDKQLRNNFTEFDNYIYSEHLNINIKKNIDKMLLLLRSKRFSESENDNIISYFVFLEENGISITRVIKDFFLLLENESKIHK